jgi:hypothetical protein
MKPATGESGKPKTEMGKAESRNSRFRVGGSPNFNFQLSQFPLFFCSRGSLTPVAAPNVF